jgi:predicted HTH transcriptional regulator
MEIDCDELAKMDEEEMRALLRELGDFDVDEQTLPESEIRDYIIENYAEDCFHLHSEERDYDYSDMYAEEDKEVDDYEDYDSQPERD